MKTARRFYETSRDIDPDTVECRYTVSGRAAIASFPATTHLRLIVDDFDDRRAALKVEGTPAEMFALGVALISVATDADKGTGSIVLARGEIEKFVSLAKVAQSKVKA